MWGIYALMASLLWGLTYVLNEQIYKKISLTTSLALTSLLLFFAMTTASILTNKLPHDIESIVSSKKLLLLVLAEIIALALAEIFIAFSITSKNATLAGMIEVSYPLFISLFAYLLFRENQISHSIILGGLLIFSGVCIIYHFNK